MAEVIVRQVDVRENRHEIRKLSDFLDKILMKEFVMKSERYCISISAVPGLGFYHPLLHDKHPLLLLFVQEKNKKNELYDHLILAIRNDPREFVGIVLYDISYLGYLKKRLNIYKGDKVYIDIPGTFD